jgi:hypothetical protein
VVIEGNLRLLYDPVHPCSASEKMGQWILLQVLVPERSEPPPLLTITRADATLNGTSASAMPVG